MFLRKVQQSYCYTKLCNYREGFVLKPISNIPNILACCNLQEIEHHQKIKNCLLFFTFNSTCCKCFALKENHYSKQTNHPQGFHHGEIGYSTKRGNWGGGASPCKSKCLNFPLLLDKNVIYWEIPHIGKKGFSNNF